VFANTSLSVETSSRFAALSTGLSPIGGTNAAPPVASAAQTRDPKACTSERL
jgi:hypothetical protein